MCLLVVLSRVIPGAPLVVAANRDEWLDRPALAMTSLSEAPRIRGGRDQRAGGTWLATSESGLVAGLTNAPMITPPTVPKDRAASCHCCWRDTPARSRLHVRSRGQFARRSSIRAGCYAAIAMPSPTSTSPRQVVRTSNRSTPESTSWRIARLVRRPRRTSCARSSASRRANSTHSPVGWSRYSHTNPSFGSDARSRSSARDGRCMRPRRSLRNTLGTDRHRP